MLVIVLGVIIIGLLLKCVSYHIMLFGAVYYFIDKYEDEITPEKLTKVAIEAFKKQYRVKF